jgi:hypothetical protein
MIEHADVTPGMRFHSAPPIKSKAAACASFYRECAMQHDLRPDCLQNPLNERTPDLQSRRFLS